MQPIEAVLRRFCTDFARLDGGLIAERYPEHFVPVTAESGLRALHGRSDLAAYFQGDLDAYRDRGEVACGFDAFEWHRIGARAFVAIVTWHLTDAGRRVHASANFP